MTEEPTSVPDGCVVVDSDYDSGTWFLSTYGGHIVPREAWERYEALQAEADTITAEFEKGDYIPGWAQNGRPKPPPYPSDGWARLLPGVTPFLNKVPRTGGTS